MEPEKLSTPLFTDATDTDDKRFYIKTISFFIGAILLGILLVIGLFYVTETKQPRIALGTFISYCGLRSDNPKSYFYYPKHWEGESLRAIFLRKCWVLIPQKNMKAPSFADRRFIPSTDPDTFYFDVQNSIIADKLDDVTILFNVNDAQVSSGNFTVSHDAIKDVLSYSGFTNSQEWLEKTYVSRSNFFRLYRDEVAQPSGKMYFSSTLYTILTYARVWRNTPVGKWLVK